MKTYLALWRRGWWAWAFVAACNVALTAILLPLVFAFRLELSDYYRLAAVVWMIVGAPIWGWLFEWFVRASIRIGSETLDSQEMIARLKS